MNRGRLALPYRKGVTLMKHIFRVIILTIITLFIFSIKAQ